MKTSTPFILGAALFISAIQLASAASDTWTGTIDTNWSNATNWSPIATPVSGDSLTFPFIASGVSNLNNDLTALTPIYGLQFSGGAYGLNGNSVLLSGSMINNTTGVNNFAGQAQTIGLPLVLDNGYYTFASGAGVALNGGLTLNPGGLAYFDANNTSTSLTLDGTTGLITGLEGSGLIYDGSFTPTGLATISGGAIGTYSGYASLTGGASQAAAVALANGNNIKLSSTGAAAFYTNNNKTVNSLFVSQVGNSGGTFTTTLTNVGTLTLGQNGGIYLLGNTLGNKACFSLNGGTLTAGTVNAPATITFAVNGNNANNQASCSATIVNNTAGGAVSVIYTGPGSMNFATTTTSSYSGGVYVDEGQLQFGQPAQIGTGPVYVATNASLYYTGTGNITNNIFLSRGTGSPTAAAAANGGALLFAGGGTANLLGTVTLNGSPVPAATYPPVAGDRVTGNNSATQITVFKGQITGTGTLDIYCNPHAENFTLANTNANNNWQGGFIIEDTSSGSATRNVIVSLGASSQIPHGAGAGDVTIYNANTVGVNTVRLDLNGFNTTINGLNAQFISVAPQVSDFGTAPSVLTLGDNNASGTFNGATTDNSGANHLSLVKIGSGTETCTGSLGHHGNTTINGGTFSLNNACTIANTPIITVASGATLDGSTLSAGGLAVGAAQTLNCVGTIAGNTVINGTIEAFDAIGTLTNNGNLTLNGGGTNVWYINKATGGTAGSDPGWSLLSVTNQLIIGSTDGSPFTINVTSVNFSDAAGNASNFNSGSSYSFPIAYAANGISGFTDSAQFKVVTSSFANYPGGASQWSVTTNVDGTHLMLNFNGFAALTTSLPLTPLVVDQHSNAVFTVTANALGSSPSFTWFQQGNPLSDGGTSAGGNSGNVSIVSSGGGYTSTLTISGVDNAGPGLDGGNGGIISVTASETYQSNPQSGSSSETLSVIDVPYNPIVTQTGVQSNPNLGGFSAGGRTYLAATASGTTPFTYQWYLGTNAVSGATNANLTVNVGAATAGNYTVVISNPAGSVTSSVTAITPVTSVPGQIIYEPFDSYTANFGFSQGSAPDTFSAAKGFTNLFNQLTGEPVFWTVAGSTGNSQIEANGMGPSSTGENQFGGTYPWPGLAGDSANEIYWTTTTVNNHLRVTTNGASLFAVGGPNTNIYFSFTMSIVSLGNGSYDGTQSVFGGFATSAGASACGLEFWTWDVAAGSSTVMVGLGKGNGTTVNNATTNNGNGSPLANVVWGPANSSPLGNNVWTQQSIFVVGCYSVVDGPGHSNDTVTLWINPPEASYYATTPPTPYLGPTSFGGTVANSVPQDFVLLNDYAPASHRITDLRIGTTWASVTPPSRPAFQLGNVYAPIGTTAVFAAQTVGNPVTGGYGWQFNGGSPLSDGPTGNGSSITGSSTSTLTISNVQPADLGIYTINGTNTDVSTNNSGALTGSVSAILSSTPPKLSVVASAPNATILWETNWLGYVLENSAAVTTNSAWTTNSLPPYAVFGTNNGVVVPASSGSKFYRLINP